MEKKINIDIVGKSFTLNKFIEQTEVVYDNQGNYSVLIHSYPSGSLDNTKYYSLYLGVNYWIEADPSCSDFDLKYDYFKFMLDNKDNWGTGLIPITTVKESEDKSVISPIEIWRPVVSIYDSYRIKNKEYQNTIQKYGQSIIFWFSSCIILIVCLLISLLF